MNYCQSFCRTIQRLCSSGATPILPPEYQQVEYLQSSGAQYIDIGVNTTNNIVFDVRFSNSNRVNSGSRNACVLGALNYANSNRYYVIMMTDAGDFICGYKGSTYNTNKHWTKDSVYDFTISIGTSLYSITLKGSDGWTWDTLISSFGSSYPILLYAYRNNATSVNSLLNGKVYYLKVTIGGTTEKEMWPCYRKSDNKPGMYDLVTDTFFTNAGSGADFTVGNNV